MGGRLSSNCRLPRPADHSLDAVPRIQAPEHSSYQVNESEILNKRILIALLAAEHDRRRLVKRESNKRWREANPEKIKAGRRRYYAKNKDRCAEYNKTWRAENREKRNATQRIWSSKNVDKIRQKGKDYYQANKARLKEYTENYRRTNPDKVRAARNARKRVRWNSDPEYRLVEGQRNRIRVALKRKNKVDETLALLGCSARDLKTYIESKFEKGMTWDSFFRGEIHVDHIKPLSSFDLRDPEQQRAAFGFSNLQPLWAEDNLAKSDKLPEVWESSLVE